MDTESIVITMSEEMGALLGAFAELKKGSRNNASDAKRIQTVHDMSKEMGVARDCNTTKAGSRFSKEDMAMVEKIHDHAVNLGAECGPEGTSNYPEGKAVDFDGEGKPYPNEHAARVADPSGFEQNSFRSKQIAPGIRIIIGKKKGSDSMETQTYRFDKDKFTAAEAKKWLADNKVKHSGFETAKEGKSVFGETKSISLQDNLQAIRDAFYAEFVKNIPGQISPWCQDVRDDGVIAQFGDILYSIPYTSLDPDGDGDVDGAEFASQDKWVKVEKDTTYVPIKMGEEAGFITAYGGAIKTMENGHLGDMCVAFSNDTNPDVDSDFFDAKTDFGFTKSMKTISGPIYVHHCLPVKTSKGVQRIKQAIGQASVTMTDDGIAIDGVLFDSFEQAHDEYVAKIAKTVKAAIKAGKMGWSTGTASHLVARTKIGKANHIDKWPLGLDFTITPTPAGIKQGVSVAMKSILMPEVDFDEPEGGTQGAASVVPSAKQGETEGSTNSNSQEINMTQEEINASVAAAVKTAFAQKEADEATKAAAVKAAADAKVAHEKEITDAVDAALRSRSVRVVRKPVNAGGVKTAAPGPDAQHDKTLYGDSAKAAWNFWLKTGDREALRDSERMNSEDADLLDPEKFGAAAKAAMKTTYNVISATQYQGLELVPVEVYTEIVELRDPISIARVGGALAISIGAKTMNVPVEKNRSGKFVIETEGSAYDPNIVQPFDKRAITAFKFTRTIAMGTEAMEDSASDLTNWWNKHVARMEALTENYYFTIGANGGASTPEGIIGGGTAALTLASSTTIAASEVVALYYKLPQAYRDNPSFMCNGTTEGIIRGLSGNWFQFAPTPSGSQNTGNYPMGSDWIISPKCKLLVASDMSDFSSLLKVACVGNWNEYIIVERSAMSVFRDPYSSAANGLVNFHCHFRRGGMVGQTEAFQYATAHST